MGLFERIGDVVAEWGANVRILGVWLRKSYGHCAGIVAYDKHLCPYVPNERMHALFRERLEPGLGFTIVRRPWNVGVLI